MHAQVRRRCRSRAGPALGVLLLCVLVTGGCARFSPNKLDVIPAAQVSTSMVRDRVQVSATVLSDDQSLRHFGVDLAAAGLQAIWLRVQNRSATDLWFLVAALDPDYYSPNEAAYLFRGRYTGEQEARLAEHFRTEAIPLLTPAGKVSEGYVFAPRHEGGRYVNVELVGHERRLQFGFPIEVGKVGLDVRRANAESLYPEARLRDVSLPELRGLLQALPCCTESEDGEGTGDPLNVVIIGDRAEVFAALARSGWSFTHRINLRSIGRLVGAAIAGTPYPVAPISPLFLFDRSHDLALQRSRTVISQRNHMRLWLTAWRVEGRDVWVGQVSRDIGVKLTTRSSSLTTHVIDPQVDETREYLLQSLLVNHAVEQFGFVEGVGEATPDSPHRNLTGDPFFTDGFRLVVVLAEGLVPPHRASNLHWREIDDPMASPEPADTQPGTATEVP